jgi:hypothetical protein
MITSNTLDIFIHPAQETLKLVVVILEALPEDQETDVVGHAAVGQPGKVHWRPLVLLDRLDVVSDLLLNSFSQDVLAHAHLTQDLQRRRALFFP